MTRVLLWPAVLGLSAGLLACGGDEDKKDESENAACTRVLDDLQACFDGWCAGDGADSAYCRCYVDDAVVGQTSPNGPCACTQPGTWRALYRQQWCSRSLEGAQVDCPATLQQAAGLDAVCG